MINPEYFAENNLFSDAVESKAVMKWCKFLRPTVLKPQILPQKLFFFFNLQIQMYNLQLKYNFF